jgi:glyoxylase-like metal-dependent hydrolase (beta-lactamase superfamily II)
MPSLDRRALLTAGSALGAMALGSFLNPHPAIAAAPATGKQAPGFYRYKIGDIEVTVVTEGARTFPLPDNFVVNQSKEEVNKALEAAYMPRDKMTIYFAPIVVNTSGKLVLIDTGYGDKMYTESKGAAGQLANNLAAAGMNAGAIDTVVISHYHQDHVDGLLRADGGLSFPNAEILVPAAEHKFWMDDGEMSRAPKGRMEQLFQNNRRIFAGEVSKRLRTYEWDKEVAPGVTAISTPGHTPGHTSFVIAAGSGKVFVQSDVTNNPVLFVRHPGWHAVFDQIPQQAEATRRKVYDMLVAEKLMVQAFHYPFPGLGHIEKDGEGYRVVPAPWNPTI